MSCANKQIERVNSCVYKTQKFYYFSKFLQDAIKELHLWDGIGIENSDDFKFMKILENMMNNNEITEEDLDFFWKYVEETSGESSNDKYICGVALDIPPEFLVPYEDLSNYSLLDLSWLRLTSGHLLDSLRKKTTSTMYYNLKINKEREMEEFHDTRRRIKLTPVPWIKEIRVVKTRPDMIEEETILEPYPPQPPGFIEVIETMHLIYDKLYTQRMYETNENEESVYLPCSLDIYKDFLKPLGYLATYDKGYVLVTL